MAEQTHMAREIAGIPDALARLLEESAPAIRDAAMALRKADPVVVATVARGSSDHAAHFLKYAIEIVLRLPVASLGPSVASVYGVTPKLPGAAVFSVSQSGKSPDIVAMFEAAMHGGATGIALVNTLPSPLGDAAHHAIAIGAGPEKSVAATKSFVCSIAAGLAVIAQWSGDRNLIAAVNRLPEESAKALHCTWHDMILFFDEADSIFVLGRGPVFAIAHEAALKFKETCGLHAEAYSAAEVLHGPVELVGPRFPVLALAAADQAEASIASACDSIAAKGAIVHTTAAGVSAAHALPRPDASHPLTSALLQAIPFYLFVEALARKRNRNPDAPRNLSKVTETR